VKFPGWRSDLYSEPIRNQYTLSCEVSEGGISGSKTVTLSVPVEGWHFQNIHHAKNSNCYSVTYWLLHQETLHA
jgi:hypothetical protein